MKCRRCNSQVSVSHQQKFYCQKCGLIDYDEVIKDSPLCPHCKKFLTYAKTTLKSKIMEKLFSDYCPIVICPYCKGEL